ncbi:MAG: HEAT repeat domain-containing protein [Candidatus Omnitrophica bacterium]|nr:HEAT repeat domain-containing protein [Candidatus Omnitrophota bacterium]
MRMLYCLLLILAFFLPPSAFAETIVFKSGKTTEDKISEKTTTYIKVDINGIPITYYLDEIATIDGVAIQIDQDLGHERTKNGSFPEMEKEYQEYLKQLQSSDPQERDAAVIKLTQAVRTDARLVAPLITALNDENAKIRIHVIQALGRPELRRENVTRPLIEALYDKNEQVRSAAASSLGRLGDPEAIKPLIRALSDNSNWVVMSAIDSLDKIGNEQAIESLNALLTHSDKRIQNEARRVSNNLQSKYQSAIARQEAKKGNQQMQLKLDELKLPKEWQPLIVQLKSDSIYTRQDCIRGLAHFKDEEAVELLLVALTDTAPSIRQEALKAFNTEPLKNFKDRDKRILQPALTMLNDPAPEVRRVAADILGDFKNIEVVNALITALGDVDGGVVDASRRSLTRIGGITIEPLIRMLKEGDRQKRRIAARILGDSCDSRAIEPLTAALNDEDDGVRLAANNGLVNIKSNIQMSGDRKHETHQGAYIYENIVADLKSEHGNVRLAAARAARDSKDARFVDLFVPLLKDKDSNIQIVAYDIMRKSKDPKAVNALIEILLDESTDGYGFDQCITALASIGDTRAVPALIKALQKKNKHNLEYKIAQALGHLKDARAIGTLIDMLKMDTTDGNDLPVRAASQALHEITGENFGIDPLPWEKWWKEEKRK